MEPHEIKAFIASLRKLASETRLSNRALASLLGVSPSTMGRWLDPHVETKRLYGYMVDSVIRQVAVLNAADQQTDLFKTLRGVSAPARLAELKDVLLRNSEQ